MIEYTIKDSTQDKRNKIDNTRKITGKFKKMKSPKLTGKLNQNL